MSESYIGDLLLKRPIIQGGMGVGISRSRLAGAVAYEGGMGVISTVQIGYDHPMFATKPKEANMETIALEIAKAKKIADGNGVIAVNVMAAIPQYREHVEKAIESGVDAIISGAGLPTDLPQYTKDTGVKIAPVASSYKSAAVILKHWDRKYQCTADFLIMESPYSGGHQGYKLNQLDNIPDTAMEFDEDVKKTIALKETYEVKYGKKIPLFIAGGIFEKSDVEHAMGLGADGVQVGTRFIATEECDADIRYKESFVKAGKEDLVIVESPVGMPARVIKNSFVEKMNEASEPITYCYNCLKGCNPKNAKYCISKALIRAVNGDVENGLIFSSLKVGQITKIQTVREVIDELVGTDNVRNSSLRY